MIERQGDQCVYLLYEHLSGMAGLQHGVFTRKRGFSAPPFDGLNVATTTGDNPASALRNQAVVSRAMELPLVSTRIVHGVATYVVERVSADESIEQMRARLRQVPADAMLTDEPGLGLFWGFGDCAPILLYDPRHRVVALAHGGWRGAAGAIGPQTISAMTERFGSRPEELLAGVGPAIQACCYRVDERIRAAFAAHPLACEAAVFEQRADADGQPALYLDVTASNARQLLAAGMRPERLEVAPWCTGCAEEDLFYSHRMPRHADGRFGVVIGLAA